MNATQRLKALVQLALVDKTFDREERTYIMNLGKANSIPEEEIESVILHELKNKEFEKVEFVGLSFDQKMEYLVSLIELMKVDGKVYLSEIQFCKDLAERLGFKRSAIDKVSSKVHADPMLNMDWDMLRKELQDQLI